MTPAPSRPVFGLTPRELLNELGWVLLIVLVTALLQGVGVLYPIERFIIDVFAATEPNADARYTAIINIDDESFAGPEFLGQRPLRPSALARLIIGAGFAGARVILVDVDTDVTAVRKEMKNDMPAVPIVWAAATRP